MLLIDSIQDSITILAQVLAVSLESTITWTQLAPTLISQPPIQNKLSEGQVLWEKIASINARLTEVQSNIEAQIKDNISILGRILAVIGVDKTL